MGVGGQRYGLLSVDCGFMSDEVCVCVAHDMARMEQEDTSQSA
jgi:hypothetical protein